MINPTSGQPDPFNPFTVTTTSVTMPRLGISLKTKSDKTDDN